MKPWEKKPSDFVKKEDGIREGIVKTDIVSPEEIEKSKIRTSLTDEDIHFIKIRRDIESKTFQDEDAVKCAARTDNYYQNFVSTLNTVDSILFKLVSSKSEFDRNASDIIIGKTDRFYSGTNVVMDIRDLKNRNIMLRRDITEALKGIWVMMAELYRYVDQFRIDRIVFYTKEDYRKRMEETKKVLNENGIDLFMEVK